MDEYNRREFIKTSVPGFLGVLVALPSLCALATRANAYEGRLLATQPLHWDAFLEAVAEEAQKQHLDHWNEESYLKKIASITRQLSLEDPVIQQAMKAIATRLEQGWVDFHDLEKRADFAVCLLQFEALQVIEPHNHPGMTGMILCASGEIHAKNYDLFKTLEEHEKDGVRHGSYLLHQSADTLMRKGDVSSLTSSARNIHRLQARQTTQLIDIFTPPYNQERTEQSCWYELDEAPMAGTSTIYEAKRKV